MTVTIEHLLNSAGRRARDGSRNCESRLELGRDYWISNMSTQPNEQLNQGAISILRLLFRHGELPISSISGLLALYETMVEHHSQELLRRELISLKRQDNQTLLRLEPKGLAYLREGEYV
jgi:hypothetical protein